MSVGVQCSHCWSPALLLVAEPIAEGAASTSCRRHLATAVEVLLRETGVDEVAVSWVATWGEPA